jgi:hypothetical protein
VLRRLLATAFALTLATTAATGCSTFTKNNNAATVNDQELTVTQFEHLLGELVKVRPDSYQGPNAQGNWSRQLLQSWVAQTLIIETLKENGQPPAASDRADLETGIAQQLPGFNTLDAATQSFIIDSAVANKAATDNPDLLPDALATAKVTIDSRYGMWNPAGAVVPTR